jgi:hypothetical protein
MSSSRAYKKWSKEKDFLNLREVRGICRIGCCAVKSRTLLRHLTVTNIQPVALTRSGDWVKAIFLLHLYRFAFKYKLII